MYSRINFLLHSNFLKYFLLKFILGCQVVFITQLFRSLICNVNLKSFAFLILQMNSHNQARTIFIFDVFDGLHLPFSSVLRSHQHCSCRVEAVNRSPRNVQYVLLSIMTVLYRCEVLMFVNSSLLTFIIIF